MVGKAGRTRDRYMARAGCLGGPARVEWIRCADDRSVGCGHLPSEQREHEQRGKAQPKLSFGRAKIGRWQPISVQDGAGNPVPVGRGRVIRVPVTNAQGAGEARDVHASLRFGDSSISPDIYPEPAQAEWVGESGPEREITLPGNGAERLLDVVVVLDKEYPHAYEWTKHSRAAGLAESAIYAGMFRVEIKVMSSNAAAVLEDTLEIEAQRGVHIRVDWRSTIGADATNLIPWEGWQQW
jgi:hypothetical protein